MWYTLNKIINSYFFFIDTVSSTLALVLDSDILTAGHLLHDAGVEVGPVVGAAHRVPVPAAAVLGVAGTGDAEAIVSLGHLSASGAVVGLDVALAGVGGAIRAAHRFEFIAANDTATRSRSCNWNSNRHHAE